MSITGFVSIIAWPLAITIVSVVIALAIIAAWQDYLIYKAKIKGLDLKLENHNIEISFGDDGKEVSV